MHLITHLTHLRYLMGFTGSSGFMIQSGKQRFFFTDFRYRGVAQELEAKHSKTTQAFTFIEWNEEGSKKLEKITKGKTLEFESGHLSLDDLKMWKKRLAQVKWAPIKHPIEELRKIKTPEEIRKMKRSQAINEATLIELKKYFRPGVTELELAWKIKTIGHDLGAEDISFEPIVAFGPHSAIPHHQNTSTKLKKTDVILVDMGMKYQGYCSDMTRTFLPEKYTNEQEAVYSKVRTAQEEAINALKAGVKASKLDEIARKSMGEEAQFFGHSLGHGIGLDVHESPNLSRRSKDVLKAGMVVTVEPGIYLDGRFGVRIENCGLVTEKGYENFMRMEK